MMTSPAEHPLPRAFYAHDTVVVARVYWGSGWYAC